MKKDVLNNNQLVKSSEPEKAILIGVISGYQTEEKLQEYLDELEFLAATAGAVVQKIFVQKLPHPDVKTFVGSGKLEEIKKYVEDRQIEVAISDDDLTGTQINVLESELGIKILDRSMLILDIFATRAQTAQAKAQVDLAQMQYLLPRLKGMWTHLERQRGGVGMRGPGEQEIETDRRVARDKIAKVKLRLAEFDKQSQTQRKTRGQMVRVALVGYTNVGKSTLLNLISKAEVLAENKLFATLDTTVRKVVFEQMPFLLSDTVGFIRKLPHHLVESFKTTLDEVRESDVLLHVVDIAHPQCEDHIAVVRQTLIDIGATDKDVIFVFNKMDLYREKFFDKWLTPEERDEIEREIRETWQERIGSDKCVFVSAVNREGIDELRSLMYETIGNCYKERYPYIRISY